MVQKMGKLTGLKSEASFLYYSKFLISLVCFEIRISWSQFLEDCTKSQVTKIDT
jgi:hypothetical protein